MSPPGHNAGSSATIQRFLRQAGRIERSDGSVLIWSIAEGRRGRRWRGSLLRGVSLVHSLLLEVTLVGRPSRLELATATGILTLHPEPDERSIHGNVVNAAGVRSIAMEWSPDRELDVIGTPIPMLVALHRLRERVRLTETVEVPVLVIDAELEVSQVQRTIRWREGERWQITDPLSGTSTTVAMTATGLPAGGDASMSWPLEAP